MEIMTAPARRVAILRPILNSCRFQGPMCKTKAPQTRRFWLYLAGRSTPTGPNRGGGSLLPTRLPGIFPDNHPLRGTRYLESLPPVRTLRPDDS
jgi:hypothetical protein